MRLLVSLATVVCLAAGAAPWATATAASAKGAFEAFFSSVESLRGTFTQETRDEGGEVLEASSGTMAIQRPERFRWVYEEPFRQVIVADGEDLWVYDAALEQVSVRPMADMLAAGPAVLLSGRYEALERDFRITDDGEPGWVRLEARDGGWQFDAVRVRMQGEVPQRLELTDHLGQTTVLTLGELETNPGLDGALFRFEPPEGVDVIGRGGAGAE
jgi:outer membrane lipoprotein carrier protein